jgi:hypothetical protein
MQPRVVVSRGLDAESSFDFGRQLDTHYYLQ